MLKSTKNRCRTGVLLAWALLSLPGCGGPTAAPPDAGSFESDSGTAPASDDGQDASPSNDAASASSHSPDRRTKWIGDVPYDVFFDRPLETYQQSTASSPPAAVSMAAPGTADPIPADPSPNSAPTESPLASTAQPDQPSAGTTEFSAIDWAQIAPIGLLEAETKDIRTRLSANLQTVATYNANTDAIETDGSVLALIAAIIERHPDSVNWQDRAPFVRQLAYDIYLNASGKGRGPFQKTKEPFDKIVGIWDGGPAPEMTAPPLLPLGEAGDRAQVMVRFDSGFNWLRSDVNSPTRMKEEKERVIRETTVLAALATALGDPTFDAADQEAYRQLLQQFVEGQQSMQQAAESDDFAAFEQARDRVQKSCDACHLEYRNSSPDQ